MKIRFAWQNRVIVSVSFLVLLAFTALLGAILRPHAFEIQDIDSRLLKPSLEHWLGTDALGRDLFHRILYGARVSLAIGILTSLSSIFIGVVVGSVSGYFGGKLDLFLMRVTEIFSIFPSMLVSILLLLFTGNSVFSVICSLAFVSWVYPARVVRAQVMILKTELHVEAAEAVGASTNRILSKHILPLVRSPLLVVLTYQIPNHILAESFLSFIGLGLQPPYASWGTLAAEGFKAMQSYPHLMASPALVLFLTLFSFQILGDALRDVFDPKTKHRLTN